MIDMHLIGYTADLRHIVLDLQPDHSSGRYRLEIDLDLFLTLDEVRERRRSAGMEAGPHTRVAGEVEEDATSETAPEPGRPAVEAEPARPVVEAELAHPAVEAEPARPVGEAEPARPAREVEDAREGDGPDQVAPDREVAEVSSLPTGGEHHAPTQKATELPAPPADSESEGKRPTSATETPQPESRLTPAEIQTLLRAGRSPRTVAKLAGIDIRRVERWLPPILAERAQVIQEAHATPLGSAAGHSRQPLVAAVTRNLSVRGTDPDLTSWTASRRVDGRWTVQLRYRDHDRIRCASWTFNRRDQTLTAGSPLAHELGWADHPGGHEEDESVAPHADGEEALADARSAEGAPPTSGPPRASDPPTPGPPPRASDPPRAALDGEDRPQLSYGQQQLPRPEQGPGEDQGEDQGEDRGPASDTVA